MISACVVIVTYNRLELLKECIDCALKQNNGDITVLIINNASSDGTKEYLDSLKDPRIVTIHEDSNLGGAGGFSEGVKHGVTDTDSEWFLMIDDDAMLTPSYIEEIDALIQKFPKTLAFSGTVYEHGIIAKEHRRRFERFEIKVDESEYEGESFKYNLSSFCGLMINRRLVDMIGYPNADLFIWYDDTEYSLRLNKVTDIMNANKAALIHKTKNANSNVIVGKFEWRRYYGMRNRFYAYSRNGHLGYGIRVLYKDFKKILNMRRNKDLKVEDRRYNTHMIIDSYRDAILGRVGKNPNYLPN